MKTKIFVVVTTMLLIAVSATAAVVTETVSYTHDGVELAGFIAYDDAVKGKRPAVLVVHEWWGLNDYARSRVKQLAGLGYVAFGLDMYGKGKATDHPNQAGAWMNEITANVDAWRARAQAGLSVLAGHPMTDTARMAAIGYCFGGATVQQLAYAGAALRGVVSFHGSPIPPPEGLESPVKILFCHGAADPFAKPEQVQAYLAAMGASNLDWQAIFYGGARHSFTNPDADAVGMEALKYDKSADMRSWAAMRAFFDEIFGT